MSAKSCPKEHLCVRNTKKLCSFLSFFFSVFSVALLLLLLLLNVEEHQESIYSIRFFGPNKKGGRKGPILVGKSVPSVETVCYYPSQ